MQQEQDIINHKRKLIESRLQQTGQKQKIQQYLRKRLIECGWRNDLKDYAKQIIHEKGLQRVKVEDLVNNLSAKGRVSVPPAIKDQIIAKIRALDD